MNKTIDKLNQLQIILASKSPRRKELMENLDIKFNVEARSVDEKYPSDIEIEEIAQYLAELKASAFPSQFLPPKQLIITADTVVIKNNKVLEKPKDYIEAFEMIKALSSSEHKVISGVCIKTNKKTKSFSSVSTVRFCELYDEEIKYYIEKYKPYDKAGAYGIQEWIGMIGIEHIEGSFYNVMGLPTQKLYHELKEFVENE